MGAWLLAEAAELAISSDVMLAAGSAAVVGGQAAGAVVHRHGFYPHAGWGHSLVSAAHDARRFRVWDPMASRRAVGQDATRAVGARHALRTTAIVCAAILGAVGLTLSTAISPAPVTLTLVAGIALLLIMPATVVMMAARSTDARSVLSRRGPHLMVTGLAQEACQVAAILIPVLVVAHTAGVTGLSLVDVAVVALVTRVVVLATPMAGIGAADATLVAGLTWIGTPPPTAVAALLVWRAGTLIALVAAAGIAARSTPVVAEQEGPSIDGVGRAAHRAVFSLLSVLPGTMRDSARRWVFDALFSVSADPWGYQQLPYERRKQQHLLNAIDPTARVVLEVGCADGHNLLAVAQHLPSATVIGTDVSARALRIARDRTAHLGRVHVVDATDEGAVRRVVNGPVDCVVLAEVLYYLGGDRGMDMALASVRPLMGPKTRVIMVHGYADASALHARAANALGRSIVSGVCVLDSDRPFEIAIAATAA